MLEVILLGKLGGFYIILYDILIKILLLGEGIKNVNPSNLSPFFVLW